MLIKERIIYCEETKRITYRNQKGKIESERILRDYEESKNLIEFQNEGLKGWKVKYEKECYKKIKKGKKESEIVIIHPENEKIKIPAPNIKEKIEELTIENGEIKNRIYIGIKEYVAEIIIEGTKEYDIATEILSEKKEIKGKDLCKGDIVKYDSLGERGEAIYLGGYYIKEISHIKVEKNNKFNKEKELIEVTKERKVNCFLEKEYIKLFRGYRVENKIVVKNGYPKEMIEIGHDKEIEKLNINEILNKEEIQTENKKLKRFNGTKLRGEGQGYMGVGIRRVSGEITKIIMIDEKKENLDIEKIKDKLKKENKDIENIKEINKSITGIIGIESILEDD